MFVPGQTHQNDSAKNAELVPGVEDEEMLIILTTGEVI